MEGDHVTAAGIANEAITDKRSGWGCLLLALVLVAIVATGLAAVSMKSDPSSNCAGVQPCVNTATNGGSTGSAHLSRITPEGWSVGAGSEQQLPHDEAASVVPPGQGSGGAGNSLNPQAPSTTPTTASHEPQPAPEVVPPAPPPPTPCDTTDPHSPCYEPPCDTSDPHGPCYEPPPYQPGDECDPSSPYYDEHAICL